MRLVKAFLLPLRMHMMKGAGTALCIVDAQGEGLGFP